ncbi:hypothetical protein ABW20_dc0106300 [Dactylellina cionopaga]|nr:hypothetical protein ABW20_dc0106300 [Dactylellina cionopaga]
MVAHLAAYIYGVGGAVDNVDAQESSDVDILKRATTADAEFENSVLHISVNQPPKSRAELEALASDMLMRKRSANKTATLEKRGNPCDQNFPVFNGESIWGCNRKPLAKVPVPIPQRGLRFILRSSAPILLRIRATLQRGTDSQRTGCSPPIPLKGDFYILGYIIRSQHWSCEPVGCAKRGIGVWS